MGTIENDDTAVLSINDVSQLENGTFTFTITSSHATDTAITGTIDTADIAGEALAGTDYTALVGVTFTILGDSTDTTDTVTVGVTTDAIVEDDETFHVNLSAPLFGGAADATRATFTGGDAQGLGTIENDDTAGNQAPTLAAITDMITKMGTAVTFTAVGNDADLPAQTLLYSLVGGGPAGATINSTTGVFSWTPTETVGNSPGQFAITVSVSDGQLTATQTCTVTVNQNSIVAPHIINGTNGNDFITIRELSQNVVRVTINGTTTNVTLTAGREIQVYALNGNDLVNLVDLTRPTYVEGGNGDDVIGEQRVTNTAAMLWLKGGDGFDTLTGGVALDHLDGGIGNDLLSGGFGNDILYGREGIDTLFGNGGMDILLGDSENDRLEGGDGDDYLSGGSGNDTMLGQTGDDILVAGDDNDIVEGGGGNDMIDAGAGSDIIRGGSGNDLLLGGLGNDNLQGEAGNDRIAGQGGFDTINGGPGTDQAVTPASGSPAMVSIETVLADDTVLLAAATAAKQAWVVRFVSGLPVNSPIDEEDVINIVLT